MRFCQIHSNPVFNGFIKSVFSANFSFNKDQVLRPYGFWDKMVDLVKAKKILIIRLSSLGDILLSTPLIRSIKIYYPHVEIDYILKSQYFDTLAHNPYLNNVLKYECINENFFEKLNQENRFDAVIDLQNNLRSRKITSKIAAPVLRFRKKNLDKFLLVHFKINRLKNAPSIPQRYADTIANFHLDEKGLDLFIPDSIRSSLGKSRKYIGLCPGSRHFTKQWPEEYFVEIGNILSKEGYGILLFGGKSDRDICKRISDQIISAKDLSNDDNLLQTAADMKECLCIICNDSGLMHTASAAGTPVAAIFGSTVKEFGFSPYKNKNLILENILLSCRPCSHIGRDKCPKSHFKCMREVTPSLVHEKIIELVNRL